MSQPAPVKRSASIWARVRRSIWREPLSDDDRSHVRQVLNDLVLHLHPTKVPARELKLTYNFGLGGLSILMFLILLVTGVMLLFVYTPTPTDAYLSIQRVQTDIWMGQFVRNLHHWSANLLLLLAVLHMLRVYYTAAFHTPREFNWIIGWGMLLLAALSNLPATCCPGISLLTGRRRLSPVCSATSRWWARVSKAGCSVARRSVRSRCGRSSPFTWLSCRC